MQIAEIEAALTHAGVAYTRDFDWTDGWILTVQGEVVARGVSIGELEQNLAPWWRAYAARLGIDPAAG